MPSGVYPTEKKRGLFVRGHIMSEDVRKKISNSLSGVKKPPGFAMGKKHSQETKNKIRDKHLGKKLSLETRNKIRLLNIGKKTPIEVRRKISEKLKGENAPNWKGGITYSNKIIRGSIEFKLWREEVFARDNWTCQKCGTRGGELEAHHIKKFSQHINIRFSIENGLTLCKRCHKLTDNYGFKKEAGKLKDGKILI